MRQSHPAILIILCLSLALAAQAQAQTLSASLIGPGIAMSVNSNFQGPTNTGFAIANVSVSADPGGSWDVATLTFASSGTGNGDTAYASLALHHDLGVAGWEGAAIDPPAASPLVGFTGGLATFTLLNPAQAASSIRRFLLIAKLAGTATSGQTLNARLEDITATTAGGGTLTGLPTINSTAVIIDSAYVTVSNAPEQPVPSMHRTGASAQVVAARYRLTAGNINVPITAITLTVTGTGNAGAMLHPGHGVAVWLDDGDGAFSAAADTNLFEGAGAPSVIATFSSPLDLVQFQPRDIWVVATWLPTAGAGAAIPLTLRFSIQQAPHVAVSGGVIVALLSPAPQGPVISVVDFFVTHFAPSADIDSGGALIVLAGGGFMHPFSVTIGGVVCPGSASISAGSQVSGLRVPPGSGENLPIVIHSGTLPPLTLATTFGYTLGFRVTSFEPLITTTVATDPITIVGQGFVLPVEVTIGGVTCAGTPAVNGAGTTITGLYVPRGEGTNLPITVTCGTFPTQTLFETFDYVAVPSRFKRVDGCAAAPTGALPLALAGLAVWYRARRPRRNA